MEVELCGMPLGEVCNVPRVRRDIKAAACECGIKGDKLDDLTLAVGEVVNDCCLHGGDECVTAIVKRSPRHLLVSIQTESLTRPEVRRDIADRVVTARGLKAGKRCHEGCSLNCDNGRGIILVVALSDMVVFARSRLVMAFRLAS